MSSLKERLEKQKTIILNSISENGFVFLSHNKKIYKISSYKEFNNLLKEN
jgi:hypothetical protein